MLALMNMYISWPILIVIIIAGIGVGVVLGLIFKNKPNFTKTSKRSGIGNTSFGGSVGGIAGSATTEYEYENDLAHYDMNKKIQELEVENSALKKREELLIEKVDILKEKVKYVEAKLNQVAKELEQEEHPICNRLMRLLKFLAAARTSNNTGMYVMGGNQDDDLINDAINNGQIQHHEYWLDNNGNQVADNKDDLLDFLRNNPNIQQLGRTRTR